MKVTKKKVKKIKKMVKRLNEVSQFCKDSECEFCLLSDKDAFCRISNSREAPQDWQL